MHAAFAEPAVDRGTTPVMRAWSGEAASNPNAKSEVSPLRAPSFRIQRKDFVVVSA
jgi:hypothetical protein